MAGQDFPGQALLVQIERAALQHAASRENTLRGTHCACSAASTKQRTAAGAVHLGARAHPETNGSCRPGRRGGQASPVAHGHRRGREGIGREEETEACKQETRRRNKEWWQHDLFCGINTRGCTSAPRAGAPARSMADCARGLRRALSCSMGRDGAKRERCTNSTKPRMGAAARRGSRTAQGEEERAC